MTDRRPTLHFDDVSAIPFLVDIAGVEEYQHRARLRCDSGDVFAAATPSTPGYEAYCRDVLGLGSPELVVTDPVGSPLEVARACSEGPAFDRLVERARDGGGMIIHPYMGIEAVWELADVLGDVSGTPIDVIAPPPAVTWIANDKARFNDLVARTVGPEHVIETRTSRDPAELAELLRDLGHRHNEVGLKRTRCASAMGNLLLAAEDVITGDAEATVRAFLDRTKWDGQEPVLAVAWEQTNISPSTQLWIPRAEDGLPRLDGIYEQLLDGPERVFVGSRPSQLPDRVNAMLADVALSVAGELQRLGYRGRCSFDHLVVGDPDGEFQLRFSECNGRWGGTSTPMSLLDRLFDGPRPPYRAQDFVHPNLVGVSFAELLERVGDSAYNVDSGRGRFIFYNVGPLVESGKLAVIAMAKTQADAECALDKDLPQLLGVA